MEQLPRTLPSEEKDVILEAKNIQEIDAGTFPLLGGDPYLGTQDQHIYVIGEDPYSFPSCRMQATVGH